MHPDVCHVLVPCKRVVQRHVAQLEDAVTTGMALIVTVR